MALIMLAELLTTKSEAEQLSPGVLPAVSGPAALITGGAVRRGEGRGGYATKEEEGRWVKDRRMK